MYCIVLAALVCNGLGDNGAIQAANTDPLTDPVPCADISLSLVSTFSAEGKALGLYMIEETALLGVNNTGMKVYGYSPTTGTVNMEISLDPSNTSCFGAAFDPASAGTFYTNDWSGDDLFYTPDWGTTWNTVFDPSFSAGRGMDFDGTHFWTTNGTGSIIRFIPEYTPFDVLSVPETSGQLSGITVFPWEGDLAVAVTSYGASGIWVYTWNGTALEYLGFGALPVTPETSYGLAYSEDLNSMFFSYQDFSDDFLIARLSIEISQALTPSTWAAVKASF